MHKCDIYHKYVHKNCVGLTKNDKGAFTCPNCEWIHKHNFKKEKLTQIFNV